MSTTTSRTVTATRSLAEVWAFLSDFTTSAEWDPHTVSCRRLDSGPLKVGSRFENVQHLAGHDSTLTYSVTELQDQERIVLEGGSDTLTTRDEMVFATAVDGGTTVTYLVDVQLHGAARAGEVIMPAVMKKIADDGADGMQRRLRDL